MQKKQSTCVGCNILKYIYAKQMCQYCYWKSKPKKEIQKQFKPIKKFTKKSLDNLKRYRIVRDKFLKENPICMYPGCISLEVTLHHGKGRLGSLLTDKRFFKSLCWPHHQHIENNPALALTLGLSYSRTSTT